MKNGFTVVKLGCINVNYLLSKVLYVKHLIEKFNLSVTAVCDTWLVSDVLSFFVAIDGFQVVRGDGSDAVRKHGCCLYISEFCSFAPVEIDIPNVVGVLLVDVNVWVSAVYRPPSYTVDQDDRLIRFLNEYKLV